MLQDDIIDVNNGAILLRKRLQNLLASGPHTHHVCAHFLREYDAAVLADYSPGAGMMLKTALVMGMKCLLVAMSKDVGRIGTRHYLLPNTT